MALERRNPLPIGRYWVDVFDQTSTHPATKGQNTQAAFRDWLTRNRPAVFVETTQGFAANDGGPARDFYIFRVSAPVTWQGPGFPEIAPAAVTSSDDTVQKLPPEKDALDQLDDALAPVRGAPGKLVFAVACGIGALVFVNLWASTRAQTRARK